jgi:hypothetical protein
MAEAESRSDSISMSGRNTCIFAVWSWLYMHVDVCRHGRTADLCICLMCESSALKHKALTFPRLLQSHRAFEKSHVHMAIASVGSNAGY